MTTTAAAGQTGIIRPFTIAIPQEALDDLQRRLANTRLPVPAPNDSWDYGTPVAYLQRMVTTWQQFDWRQQEARMNAVPNFVTEIDGQTVHFIRVRSTQPGATPLLLAHTYPGSFAEFLDMIGPLTDPVAYGGRPQDAFDVVIPSMPGFGFSTPLIGEGWTMARVAQTYDTLMRRLGYESYGTHGSDSGALISRELAILDPPGFLGAHVLQLFSFPSGEPGEFDQFGPKEYAALEFLGWFQSVGGYNQMNGTRPQTIAAALSDSPVGQLAYNELFENFGNGTSLVTEEQVLTQVSLYWLTNTSATAVRYHYSEAHSGAKPVVSQGRIGVAGSHMIFKPSGRFPNATMPTSCIGRSSTPAGTTPRSRFLTSLSVICAPFSATAYLRIPDHLVLASWSWLSPIRPSSRSSMADSQTLYREQCGKSDGNRHSCCTAARVQGVHAVHAADV